MKLFGIVTTCAFALVVVLSPRLFAQDSEWETGVAKVSVDKKLQRNPGTAVVIGIKGDTAFLVTCFHVIQGDSSPTVEFLATPGKLFTATLNNYQRGSGDAALALLQVDGVPKHVHAILLATPGRVGDTISIAGFPVPDGVFTVINANIASEKAFDVSVSHDTPEGFSGGPVIQANYVVALIWGREAGFGRAMSGSAVREYAKSLNVPLFEERSGSVMPGNFECSRAWKPGSREWTDPKTGLTWLTRDLNSDGGSSWAQAKATCEAMGFRMPTFSEVDSLVQENHNIRKVWFGEEGYFNVGCKLLISRSEEWTSTVDPSFRDSNNPDDHVYHTFIFDFDYVRDNGQRTMPQEYDFPTLCVRRGGH